MDLMSLFLSSIIVHNIVIVKFLGMCPFMGVSKKAESAVGMGGAVTFVIVFSSIITYFLNYYVLVPAQVEYMSLIVFILVIASFVQLTEIIIKYFLPSLYRSLGIYLPLITTNCAVLYVAKENINQGFTFAETLTYAFGVSIGFTLILYIYSTIRERMELANPPKAFKGNPLALIVAAIMALAISGLSGVI